LNANSKQIALFDFDGTLTRTDSLLHFLWFCIPFGKFLSGIVRFLPTYLMYITKVTGNSAAKEQLFHIFFSGLPVSKFHEMCNDFSLKVIPRLLRSEAIKKLDWHRNQGHEVVIVSASISDYLAPYFQERAVVVIATEPEMKHGLITGKFSTPNCYGPEKPKRILERFNINDYSEIYVYGDSSGDTEMLAMGTRQFFRKFY
jgi:phosphatidylglycerophosphatase C